MDRLRSRRQFMHGVGVGGLGLLAGCGRLPWQAQAPAKVPRIGFLSGDSTSPNVDGFRQGLRELGYVEGQNIIVDYRFAEGSNERFHDIAAELVRLQVDAIVTVAYGTWAAIEATRTIPVVTAGVGDPVGTGLIASLARPGGNLTGFSLLTSQLVEKRLELLKGAFPEITRVAVLWNSASREGPKFFTDMQRPAQTLHLQLQSLEVQAPHDFDGALEAATRESAGGLYTLADSLTFTHRARIVELAAKNRLPAMYELRPFVDAGGLMVYGPNQFDMHRRAAIYVDKILKGAKPADLPVEQPTKFDFIINLRTAQALGLTIPPHVLLQATEVLQ